MRHVSLFKCFLFAYLFVFICKGSLSRGRGQFIEKYVFLCGESKEDGIIKNIVYICRDLGKTISHVELNTPKITDKQLQEIEATCNEHIRQHRPLIVHYLTKEEALELKEVIDYQ